MAMPNRNVEGDYRYGYQGGHAEKEPELEGHVNSFELRLWDSRIGRWLTTDPYRQHASPYLGMGNNPITRTDHDGGCDGNENCSCSGVFETQVLDEVVVTALRSGSYGFDAVPAGMNLMDVYSGSRSQYWIDFPEFAGQNYTQMVDTWNRLYGENGDFLKTQLYAQTVENQAGKPYVWGANGPDSFDCSGTACYGIRQAANPNFGDYSANSLFNQFSFETNNRGRGTVIFYDYTSDGIIDHVTTVLNSTHMLHPSQGKEVLQIKPLSHLDSYVNKRGGTKYFREINWQNVGNQ